MEVSSDVLKVLKSTQQITLSLMKQLLQLEIRSLTWRTFRTPALSKANIRAGVFTGAPIQNTLECKEFPEKLRRKLEMVWKSEAS